MPKTIIALMYDFDKTLCTKDMQEYSFIPGIGMEPAAFWKESNDLAEEKKMDKILAYMYTMIKKSDAANKPIGRSDFMEHGRNLEFFPGVEDWFDRINRYAAEMDVQIEHYIISSGLKEIIEGSSIKKEIKEIYASEYYYNINGIACWPKNAVNYTTKTQYLFRINKGVFDISDDDGLNKYVPEDERYIPFRNMIYIGDSATDIPCMKLVKANGGYSIAVHKTGDMNTIKKLIEGKRIDFYTLADYSEGSELESIVKKIILKMVMTDDLWRKSDEQKRATG